MQNKSGSHGVNLQENKAQGSETSYSVGKDCVSEPEFSNSVNIMCVYVCMCVCVQGLCIHVHIYIHTYVCVHSYMHIVNNYICLYICVSVPNPAWF